MARKKKQTEGWNKNEEPSYVVESICLNLFVDEEEEDETAVFDEDDENTDFDSEEETDRCCCCVWPRAIKTLWKKKTIFLNLMSVYIYIKFKVHDTNFTIIRQSKTKLLDYNFQEYFKVHLKIYTLHTTYIFRF